MSFLTHSSRNGSIQFLPITRQRSNLLNCLWNLALATLVAFRMLDTLNAPIHYSHDPQLSVALQEKPLFALLINFFVPYVYNLSFFANILYFLALNWNNSTFIRLLDLFQPQIFLNRRKSIKLFSCILILQHLFFLSGNWKSIVFFGYQRAWLKMLKAYIGSFYLYLNIHTPFTLILFGKYATFHLLREIKDNFGAHPNIHRLQIELIQLARSTEHLHRLVAFPCLTMGISFTAELLVTSSVTLLTSSRRFDFFFLYFTILLFSICFLEMAIHSQLKQIMEMIAHPWNCTIFKRALKCYPKPLLQMDRRSICHLEFLPLYRPYFTFRIFNLIDINFACLFVLLIFILNYLVLLIQTSA